MSIYLIHWLLASLTIMITAYLVPGIHVDGFIAALIAAIVIGIVNTLVWPILTVITLPLTIITFGLFLFVVNGLALKIAAALSPGFTIDGFMPAVFGSIILTILGWLVRFVFFKAPTF